MAGGAIQRGFLSKIWTQIISIFRNKKGKREKSYLGETREVTIFLINPTADGLVGDVVEGHALGNHGSQEETRAFMLYLLHGFQGIHLGMGGFVSKALPCWNPSLNKRKGRLNSTICIKQRGTQYPNYCACSNKKGGAVYTSRD